MDPATFRRLESLFEQAVALTAGERDAFVRRQCGDDSALADKLRRMLRLDAGGTRSVMSALDSSDGGGGLEGRIVGLMDAPGFSRLESLFAQAVELPENEREEFVRRECGGDEVMRDKLRGMLRADIKGTPGVMAALDDVADTPDANLGRIIGSYRIDERIGAGAMAVVYRARRADGAYEQEVALKLISGRLVDPDLRWRFLRERQVLASLHHPGIAHLLDGGVTEDGTPYLVMELVPGRPITDFCDERRLNLEERLQLFEQVCDAVRHAHANLVVHRDLKPAHILVDDAGQPRLLDFGIAAVLDEAAADSKLTLTRQRRFTPQYASPEQVAGKPVTTAADVYALGLILFELLSGRRPYCITSGASDLDRQLICDTLPDPPSRRLLTNGTDPDEAPPEVIAAARRLDPAALRRRLHGDLDLIAMTALRKEPERRYASAEAMREDLRRYRERLPIAARADSFAYRSGKFVRRNRLAVAASAALVVAMLAATTISTRYAYRAEQQAKIANAVVDFLRNDLLSRADPHTEPDRNITLSAVLDRAANAIGDRFQQEPLVKAALRSTLGVAYLGLGEAQEALQHYEAAYTIRVEALGPSHAETLGARSAMLDALIEAGAFERAGEIVPGLLSMSRRELGEHHPVTLATLKHEALVHDGLGAYEAAIASMERAVSAHEGALGAEDRNTLTARNDLALMLVDAGRHEKALPTIREVLDIRRNVFGRRHPDTLLSLASLGYVLSTAGRDAEAEVELREAVALARDTLGADHPRTAAYLYLLATALRGQNRSDEAEPVASEALEIRRAQLRADHPETLMSLSLQGSLLQDLGRFDEALPLLRECYEIGVRTRGRDHPSTLIAANNVANILLEMKRPDEAQTIAAETVALARDGLPEGYWLIGAFETNHGHALLQLGRFDESEAVLRSAEGGLAAALGPGHARVQRVQELLAELDARRQ